MKFGCNLGHFRNTSLPLACLAGCSLVLSTATRRSRSRSRFTGRDTSRSARTAFSWAIFFFKQRHMLGRSYKTTSSWRAPTRKAVLHFRKQQTVYSYILLMTTYQLFFSDIFSTCSYSPLITGSCQHGHLPVGQPNSNSHDKPN